MEAGTRCFDERVPEELNRKVLDHLKPSETPGAFWFIGFVVKQLRTKRGNFKSLLKSKIHESGRIQPTAIGSKDQDPLSRGDFCRGHSLLPTQGQSVFTGK